MMSKLRENWEKVKSHLPEILISIGIVLRVKAWLENRSLWLDEAYLGLHVMSKSWVGILLNRQWAHDLPVPPMGFMLMEKVDTFLFGNNELALRLFPLCCGIAAIFLFYVLAKRLLSFRGMILVLTLFVFNSWLINYSAELKQYSTDLVVVLALSTLFIFKTDDRLSFPRKDAGLFALAGMLAVTFSDVAILVLAGFGICQQAKLLRAGRLREAERGVIVGFFWLLIFVLWYKLSISRMAVNPDLIDAVKDPGYMINVPLWSWDGLRWYGNKVWDILSNVGSLKPFFLALVLFLAGAVAFARRNKKVFVVLITPLIVAFFAAALKKYLLGGRFSLFMMPAVFVCVAWGLDRLTRRFHLKGMVFFWVCAGIFLLATAPLSVKRFVYGHPREETRQYARYLQANFRPGDVLFVNDSGTMALWYYFAQNGSFRIPTVILTTDDILNIEKQPAILISKIFLMFNSRGYFHGYSDQKSIKRLRMDGRLDIGKPKRIWFFGGHIKGVQQFILAYFEKRGIFPTVHKEKPGAVLIMFDMTKKRNSRI